MKINEITKLKILFYWDLGIPVAAIALILKISETYVKNHLRLNDRYGPPPKFPQAYQTWLYLNQNIGEPLLPPMGNQQREQELLEENSAQEEKITQLTDERDKAKEQVRDLTLKIHQFDDLKQKVTQLTDERDKAKEQGRTLTTENEDLKKNVTQQTDKLKIEKREKEELKETFYTLYKEYKTKIEEEHHNELAEQKNKGKEKDQYILKIQEELQKTKGELTETHDKLNLSNETIKKITEEKDHYKHEAWSLTLKQKNAPLKYAVVGVVCAGAGAAFGWWLRGRNQTLPVSIGTTTSGTFYSGAIVTNYGETYAAGYEPMQQDAITQPGMYHNSGVPLGINTGFPNHQDGLHQPEIQGTSGDITISTYTSGIPYSGTTESTHIISREDVPPIYSPPLMTPIPYIPLTPPDNPLDSPLMQQLILTSGRQFEEYLQGFFIYQGLPTELTKKSHDKGADLIVKHPLGRTVIQARQRKDHAGFDAINAVNGARTEYNAPRAIVITTSQFTNEALKHAKKLGVECWDGKRLLEELYKWQYFKPPV